MNAIYVTVVRQAAAQKQKKRLINFFNLIYYKQNNDI